MLVTVFWLFLLCCLAEELLEVLQWVPKALEEARSLLWTGLDVVLGQVQVMVEVLDLRTIVFFVSVSQSQGFVIRRRADTGDPGRVPLPVGPTADGGGVSLDVTLVTVIPQQTVDLISRSHRSRHTSVFDHRRLTTRYCSLLAGEGKVVVTGYIVPLSSLMPDHHYTVLSRLEEAVGLVGPPVVILHRSTIGPPEVPLKHLVIETDPLVVTAQTVDIVLLLLRQDGGEVCSV